MCVILGEAGGQGSLPYQSLKDRNVLKVSGLPDGLIFKKPSRYGRHQHEKILKAAEQLSFQISKWSWDLDQEQNAILKCVCGVPVCVCLSGLVLHCSDEKCLPFLSSGAVCWGASLSVTGFFFDSRNHCRRYVFKNGINLFLVHWYISGNLLAKMYWARFMNRTYEQICS